VYDDDTIWGFQWRNGKSVPQGAKPNRTI